MDFTSRAWCRSCFSIHLDVISIPSGYMLTIKTCTLVGNFVKRIGQTDFRLVKILPNIIFSNRFLEIEGSAKSLLHSAKIKRHDTFMFSAAFCWQGVHHPMSSTLRTGRNKFCCRVEHSRQKLNLRKSCGHHNTASRPCLGLETYFTGWLNTRVLWTCLRINEYERACLKHRSHSVVIIQASLTERLDLPINLSTMWYSIV